MTYRKRQHKEDYEGWKSSFHNREEEEYDYPNMRRLWSAQARQMVNMAGLAADMLSSSEVFGQLGVTENNTASFVLSPHDMYRLIANTVERDEGVASAIPYVQELSEIAKEGMWMSEAGNWGVPGGALGGAACKRKDPPAGSSSGDSPTPPTSVAPSEADDTTPGGLRRGRSSGAPKVARGL